MSVWTYVLYVYNSWFCACVCVFILPFSAGVGRTGTFITLDAMMERLKERDDLNIFEFVNEMRTRRMCMVQTVVSVPVSMQPNVELL